MMKKCFLHMAALFLFLCCCRQLNAQDLNFEWAIKMGGHGMDRATSVAVDKEGNVYTTGFFSGAADFDPGPDEFRLIADSTIHPRFGVRYISSTFVTKVDAGGKLVWAKKFPSSLAGGGRSITVNDSGDVYICGGYTKKIVFDTITLTALDTTAGNYPAMYVAHLDSSGAVRWAKSIGSKGSFESLNSVRADAAGNVYVTGCYADTLRIDAHKLSPSGFGNKNILVAKFDAAGNAMWAKGIGGSGDDEGKGIAVDSMGYVYIGGNFNALVDFDPGANTFNLSATGGYDAFLLKLDAAGNFVWANKMGGVGLDELNGITLDGLGNIYTAGRFSNIADFNPDSTSVFNLVAVGNIDICIAKYNTDGKFGWARSVGGKGFNWCSFSVAADVVGNVYYTGLFGDSIDLDPGPDTYIIPYSNIKAGGYDLFYSKLDPEGNFVWANSVATGDGDWLYGLEVDRSGNVYLAQAFGGSTLENHKFDFDPGPDTFYMTAKNSLQGYGEYDIFVLKLSCQPDSAQAPVNSCAPYTINGETFSESGVYTTIFSSRRGCDSVVTIDLNIETPEAVITIAIDTLSTTQAFAAYQWLKGGAIIAGAENATYGITENGDYQVIVSTKNGCTDTSDIYEVRNLSVPGMQTWTTQIRLYPNPTENILYIDSPVPLRASLSSIDGRTLATYSTNENRIALKQLAQGVYILQLSDENGNIFKIEKIVKQ